MSELPPAGEHELARFTLTGRREIVFQLRNLIRSKERVLVTFDEGRQSFLTVLIDLYEDNDLLFFDMGGSEEINRDFLRSQRCHFSCIVAGIRIQFSGRQPRLVKLSGEKVLAVDIPGTLLRLQRREAFRLSLPSTKPYLCHVRRGMPDAHDFPIYDISVGGIGIQIPQAPDLEALQILDNCWLDLRESGAISVALEIRYVTKFESRQNKPFWHIGCKFIDLSPNNETLIQRFMAKIEVERRALAAG